MRRFFLSITALLFTVAVVITACKKDEEEDEEKATIPTVSTYAASNITVTGATVGGSVISDGGAAITARGVCWSTSNNPTTVDSNTEEGTGNGHFRSNINGLTAGTFYYVRAYATNSLGTAYGNSVSFRSEFNYGSLTDVAGNVYKTLTIGTQTWMVENLKTTKYNNGDPIVNITDNDAWFYATTAAYCWLFNDQSFATSKNYGALYNFYAVEKGNLCPTGWHVPTDTEWTTLENYLADNGYNYDGTLGGGGSKIAKSLSIATGWYSSDNSYVGSIGNTDYPEYRNKSGFSALPASCRYRDGSFCQSIDYISRWWSSTKNGDYYSWYRSITHESIGVYRGTDQDMAGASVRCVKD